METPNIGTIEGVASLLGVDDAATAKAMPVMVDGRVVLALVRGDDRLDEAKLAAVVEAAVRPAQPEEIRETFGADGGSIGPVGTKVEIVADETLREGQFVAGANRHRRWHLRGVQAGRDYDARFADIRETREGDSCPKCGGALRLQSAIEVGHIFKLGTFYSVPLDATFLDEDGQEKPLIMGSYGIGPGRTMAAVIEQHHDEHGSRSGAPHGNASRRISRLHRSPMTCSVRAIEQASSWSPSPTPGSGRGSIDAEPGCTAVVAGTRRGERDIGAHPSRWVANFYPLRRPGGAAWVGVLATATAASPRGDL